MYHDRYEYILVFSRHMRTEWVNLWLFFYTLMIFLFMQFIFHILRAATSSSIWLKHCNRIKYIRRNVHVQTVEMDDNIDYFFCNSSILYRTILQTCVSLLFRLFGSFCRFFRNFASTGTIYGERERNRETPVLTKLSLACSSSLLLHENIV